MPKNLLSTRPIINGYNAIMVGIASCIASPASADVSDMFGKATDEAREIGSDLPILFAVGGIFVAGIGCWNLYRKSKEGDHSNIGAGKTYGMIFAGLMMTAITFIIGEFGSSIGISDSDRVDINNL